VEVVEPPYIIQLELQLQTVVQVAEHPVRIQIVDWVHLVKVTMVEIQLVNGIQVEAVVQVL
jgi:hypothetical protein